MTCVTPRQVSSILSPLVSPSSPSLTSTTLPRTRNSYQALLSSYSSYDWYGKPLPLSPLQCSKWGWRCVSRDVLECSVCKVKIHFVCGVPSWHHEQYDKICKEFGIQIQTSHETICPWSGKPCSDEMVFGGRISLIYDKSDFISTFFFLKKSIDDGKVPEIELSGALLKRVIPTLPIIMKDVLNKADYNEITFDIKHATFLLLSLFGWRLQESTLPTLHCKLCLRTLGLWNFKRISCETGAIIMNPEEIPPRWATEHETSFTLHSTVVDSGLTTPCDNDTKSCVSSSSDNSKIVQSEEAEESPINSSPETSTPEKIDEKSPETSTPGTPTPKKCSENCGEDMPEISTENSPKKGSENCSEAHQLSPDILPEKLPETLPAKFVDEDMPEVSLSKEIDSEVDNSEASERSPNKSLESSLDASPKPLETTPKSPEASADEDMLVISTEDQEPPESPSGNDTEVVDRDSDSKSPSIIAPDENMQEVSPQISPGMSEENPLETSKDTGSSSDSKTSPNKPAETDERMPEISPDQEIPEVTSGDQTKETDSADDNSKVSPSPPSPAISSEALEVSTEKSPEKASDFTKEAASANETSTAECMVESSDVKSKVSPQDSLETLPDKDTSESNAVKTNSFKAPESTVNRVFTRSTRSRSLTTSAESGTPVLQQRTQRKRKSKTCESPTEMKTRTRSGRSPVLSPMLQPSRKRRRSKLELVENMVADLMKTAPVELKFTSVKHSHLHVLKEHHHWCPWVSTLPAYHIHRAYRATPTRLQHEGYKKVNVVEQTNDTGWETLLFHLTTVTSPGNAWLAVHNMLQDCVSQRT